MSAFRFAQNSRVKLLELITLYLPLKVSVAEDCLLVQSDDDEFLVAASGRDTRALFSYLYK